MTKRVHKSTDGKYHIGGKTFTILVGSRAQVHHGTAYKTKGGLTKDKLLFNKHGRVVSRKKHNFEKKHDRLAKYGIKAKKGEFGPGGEASGTRKRKGKGSRKRRKGSRRRRSRRRR